MTYCVGMKIRDSLVAIADTRITSGNQTTTAKKISTYQKERHSLFIMTSGLRAVRDKTLTYFDDAMEGREDSYNKVYKAVNAFAEQLRRVADEDKKALSESGLHFNLHAIIGGQCSDDTEQKLYLLYPEGNWVEVGIATPFFIIGNTGYGKPVLDRVVTAESDVEFALKAGFLSFDATRLSTNDVGFPLDVLLYKRDTFRIIEARYKEEELASISRSWNESIVKAIHGTNGDWIHKLTQQFNSAPMGR